jgi:hypothetical protein
MVNRGEQPVKFGRPLPVPARDFKILRPVPARARKFESRAARLQEKSGFFVVKKVEIQIFIEKIY